MGESNPLAPHPVSKAQHGETDSEGLTDLRAQPYPHLSQLHSVLNHAFGILWTGHKDGKVAPFEPPTNPIHTTSLNHPTHPTTPTPHTIHTTHTSHSAHPTTHSTQSAHLACSESIFNNSIGNRERKPSSVIHLAAPSMNRHYTPQAVDFVYSSFIRLAGATEELLSNYSRERGEDIDLPTSAIYYFDTPGCAFLQF